MRPPRHALPPLVLAIGVFLGACAAGPSALPVPSPAEIPELESRFESDPGDVDVGLRLAAAYREDGRSGEALALVQSLLAAVPDDPGLLVMSGLLAEDAGDPAAARVAYQAVLDGPTAADLREEVERRLETVRRAEFRAEVVDALEREDEVAQNPPDPATVGVFPFFLEGGDPDWEPLALALPEMLATDLAVTGRLQVLERIHVQALLDEIALGESGRADPATAARSGRLLGSGNIVQGRIRIADGARIGVDAAIVEVGSDVAEQVEPLTDEDAIEALFDLEKRLALDLHEELGVQLTPAERERITERQTESVQALLEFGRGIAAENSGDFNQARAHFQTAVSIDPGFVMAEARSNTMGQLANTAAANLAGNIRSRAQLLATQRQAVRLLRNAPPGLRDRIFGLLGARKRAILAEILGQDRVGQVLLLELVFTGPSE